MKKEQKHFIFENATVKDALEKLNEVPESLTLFVLNQKQQLVGTLTDGDIRRNLLMDKSIHEKVEAFMHRGFRRLIKSKFRLEQIQEFREQRIRQVPLLDDDNRVLRILDFNKLKSLLPVDAVVMAGGRGERLKPLTDSIPKPLLKIGDKSIIERNIDRLAEYGISNIFITVKYLAEQIVDAFENRKETEIKLNFINEGEPLGTIGSVSLINNFLNDFILVMNSDLLTNIDFEDFFLNFIEEKADMSVASVPYHVVVPYAVLEKKENQIISFKEKPTYTYYSNAGIYLIRRKLLHMIPVQKQFNATDFMDELIKNHYKVIQFPILGYWLDIGKHEDYQKAQVDVKHIKF